MEVAAESEYNSLDLTPKYFAAIQITRPKSASKTGSFANDSSINQSFKVAKLVLPVQSKGSVKSNQQKSPSTTSANLSKNKTDNNNEDTVKRKELQQHGIELERLKSLREEREKIKTLNSPQQRIHKVKQQQQPAIPVHSPNTQHKSKMDEAARREAREFMKKQREKRKMEVKKDVDKSFVIKERLEELRKSTKNAVVKSRKTKSPVKVLSPKEDLNYYSMENYKMKEVKVLRLKPISTPKADEENLKEDKLQSPGKKSLSPVKKPSTPTKKLQVDSTLPLQARNTQRPPLKRELPRPSSAKENCKPIIDDLKLKVPDIKLNLTANINRTDMLSTTNNRSATTIPYFLQNVYQPYPHNFIWAVRKKLEAFVQQQKQPKMYRSHNNLETPQLRKSRKSAKGRKIAHEMIPELDYDSYKNVKSVEQEEEANTISEISSIRTDLAKSKSQSQEKAENDDDGDDTTISESIFQSLNDDPFIGKKRESINSEFDRASFDKKVHESVVPANVSPNTSEKRNNFLSSTKDDVFKVPQIPQVNSVAVVDEKEEEFRKMLLAFNKSLSHVVEVNQLLSSALVSKSSSPIASSKKSEVDSASKQEYSSSFEKNIDTNNDGENTNSSIQTLIENSEESATLKHETNDDHTIEDPPIIFQQEQAQELTSSTTKVTTERISGKDDQEQQKQNEDNNTLNESQLINLFKLATDAEVSFNTSTTTLVESNGTLSASHAAFVFNKSSSEIKSWERSLIERTRGQVAWLELQKQHLKRYGHTEKVSTIKRQQRAILMRLDKERTQLRENSEKSVVKAEEDNLIDQALEQLEMSIDGNGSDARENIERILKQREHKIDVRRKKIEYLMKWQKRLDEEEKMLKKMENKLLDANKRKKKSDDDLLNTSLEMVKSIDKSLKVLDSVEVSNQDETVDVKGEKMNKLWLRLTGMEEEKFTKCETYHLTKKDLGKFYEEAKERVLESDLKMLLETSLPPQKIEESPDKVSSTSDVDTMNSIANIETEEEYPGSYQPESATLTASTENEDELRQFMANQMKVFVSSPVLPTTTTAVAAVVNDQTFQVQDGKLQGEYAASPQLEMMVNKQDESTLTIDEEEDMDVIEEADKSSIIFTEPIELNSIDLSAVDKDGFIIPEESRSIQVTDMDDEDEFVEGQLIEDISFPNLEISLNETTQNLIEEERAHDLSTITECTEYEQGSSSGPISSEIVTASYSSTPSSERVNSEIEQRLISINDSLEQVEDAFKKVAVVPTQTTPSSEQTYSTDKDFESEEKTKNEEESKNLLILSPPSVSSESVTSQITTSTPKVLMPEVISYEETKIEE